MAVVNATWIYAAHVVHGYQFFMATVENYPKLSGKRPHLGILTRDLQLFRPSRNKQVSGRAYEKCEVSPEHIDSNLMLPIRSTTNHSFSKNSRSYCTPTFSRTATQKLSVSINMPERAISEPDIMQAVNSMELDEFFSCPSCKRDDVPLKEIAKYCAGKCTETNSSPSSLLLPPSSPLGNGDPHLPPPLPIHLFFLRISTMISFPF
jgi:hypothetical protein